MAKRLTEVFQVRLTPELKKSLDRGADRLGLRSSDVARIAIAEYVGIGRSNQPLCGWALETQIREKNTQGGRMRDEN